MVDSDSDAAKVEAETVTNRRLFWADDDDNPDGDTLPTLSSNADSRRITQHPGQVFHSADEIIEEEDLGGIR